MSIKKAGGSADTVGEGNTGKVGISGCRRSLQHFYNVPEIKEIYQYLKSKSFQLVTFLNLMLQKFIALSEKIVKAKGTRTSQQRKSKNLGNIFILLKPYIYIALGRQSTYIKLLEFG